MKMDQLKQVIKDLDELSFNNNEELLEEMTATDNQDEGALNKGHLLIAMELNNVNKTLQAILVLLYHKFGEEAGS
jgi:hypothetical protein